MENTYIIDDESPTSRAPIEKSEIDVEEPTQKPKKMISFKNLEEETDLDQKNKKNISFKNELEAPPSLLVQVPSFHSEVHSQVSQATTSKDRTSSCSTRKTPISNLPLIENQTEYIPAEYEFKGFKTINPRKNCCICPPRPSMMNTRGWLSWGFLAVVFWPLSFLPCILPCSYDPYQIPVYDRISYTNDSR